MLADEVADAFDGKDPLKPAIREGLNHTREELEALFEDAPALGLSLQQREPTEDEMDERAA